MTLVARENVDMGRCCMPNAVGGIIPPIPPAPAKFDCEAFVPGVLPLNMFMFVITVFRGAPIPMPMPIPIFMPIPGIPMPYIDVDPVRAGFIGLMKSPCSEPCTEPGPPPNGR